MYTIEFITKYSFHRRPYDVPPLQLRSVYSYFSIIMMMVLFVISCLPQIAQQVLDIWEIEQNKTLESIVSRSSSTYLFCVRSLEVPASVCIGLVSFCIQRSRFSYINSLAAWIWRIGAHTKYKLFSVVAGRLLLFLFINGFFDFIQFYCFRIDVNLSSKHFAIYLALCSLRYDEIKWHWKSDSDRR